MAYRIIDTGIWQDAEFYDASLEEKVMFLYALSSSNSNQAGFYRLPARAIENDLRINAKAVLEKPTKLFKYDFTTEQILIPNFLKYNMAKSESQLKGLATSVRGNAYCPLFITFVARAERYGAGRITEYLSDGIKKYLRVEARKRKDDPEAVVVLSMLGEPYI